ncbi:hypothetical protein NRB20_48280 [Nocardia sp. RB20]|uniref:Uncharacterized protein n=1 Tax=Nocardia macrotermitis TaxID=2585198 RepID=A0A7K0D7I0_9NOCA|nr:hypothetical protein [Nocardia macrotermitis]
MGRPTRRSVRHYAPLPDGGIGCQTCGAPATWWADFAHNSCPRFITTAYCDQHGHTDLRDPNTTARKIR